MGTKKIVIDTNNLISALGWEGSSRELVRRVIGRDYELFISLKQLAELQRVIAYPKFAFTEQQKNSFLALLSEIATFVDTTLTLKVARDPDDNMLLECAIEVNADFLISGDEHLRELRQFGNTKILSVNEFLRE